MRVESNEASLSSMKHTIDNLREELVALSSELYDAQQSRQAPPSAPATSAASGHGDGTYGGDDGQVHKHVRFCDAAADPGNEEDATSDHGVAGSAQGDAVSGHGVAAPPRSVQKLAEVLVAMIAKCD